MEIDPRHLRVLLETARAGSVSAAARTLGISQPALTTQLRRIEESLGCRVFDRDRGGVSPTSVGREVLARAVEALAVLRTVHAAAETAPGARPLTVLTDCLPIEAIMGDLPPRLRDRRWTTREADPESGFEAVRRGRADLFAGVRWPHAPWPGLQGLASVRAVTESMAVMMPATHALAGTPLLTLESLADVDWVARPGLPTTERECDAAGFECRIQYHRSEGSAYLALVGSGLAVAFTSPTVHVTRNVVVRPYRNSSVIEWVLVHDPGVLPAEDVEAIAVALRDRHAQRLQEVCATIA